MRSLAPRSEVEEYADGGRGNVTGGWLFHEGARYWLDRAGVSSAEDSGEPDFEVGTVIRDARWSTSPTPPSSVNR